MENYLETISPLCKNVETARLELEKVLNEPYTDVILHMEKLFEAQNRVIDEEAKLRAMMRFLDDDEVCYNGEPIKFEDGSTVSGDDYFTT